MYCLQVLNLTQTDNFINLSSLLPFFFLLLNLNIKFHVYPSNMSHRLPCA